MFINISIVEIVEHESGNIVEKKVVLREWKGERTRMVESFLLTDYITL